jgi:hypothetical protein
MTVPHFFKLFLEELRSDHTPWYYYKFLTDPKKPGFRKGVLLPVPQVHHIGPKKQAIWDCGCGYGRNGNKFFQSFKWVKN